MIQTATAARSPLTPTLSSIAGTPASDGGVATDFALSLATMLGAATAMPELAPTAAPPAPPASGRQAIATTGKALPDTGVTDPLIARLIDATEIGPAAVPETGHAPRGVAGAPMTGRVPAPIVASPGTVLQPVPAAASSITASAALATSALTPLATIVDPAKPNAIATPARDGSPPRPPIADPRDAGPEVTTRAPATTPPPSMDAMPVEGVPLDKSVLETRPSLARKPASGPAPLIDRSPRSDDTPGSDDAADETVPVPATPLVALPITLPPIVAPVVVAGGVVTPTGIDIARADAPPVSDDTPHRPRNVDVAPPMPAPARSEPAPGEPRTRASVDTTTETDRAPDNGPRPDGPPLGIPSAVVTPVSVQTESVVAMPGMPEAGPENPAPRALADAMIPAAPATRPDRRAPATGSAPIERFRTTEPQVAAAIMTAMPAVATLLPPAPALAAVQTPVDPAIRGPRPPLVAPPVVRDAAPVAGTPVMQVAAAIMAAMPAVVPARQAAFAPTPVTSSDETPAPPVLATLPAAPEPMRWSLPPAAAPVTIAAAQPPFQPQAGTVASAARIFGAAMQAAAVPDDRVAASTDLTAGVFGLAAPQAAAPVAAIAQPPLDMRQERWPEAMIARIEILRDAADASDTRIRLVPDALGAIDVSVKRDGDTVRVHFTAEQATTRTLLQEAQPRLAELAETRGLKLAQTGTGPGVDSGQAGQQRQPATPQPRLPAAPPRTTAKADADTDSRLA